MDAETFIEKLSRFKLGDDIFHVELPDVKCYAFDVKKDERTYFTADSNDECKGLVVSNKSMHTIHHICVDGGMVTYGLWDYMGDGVKHGRFDCLLFDDTSLLLVEFKMESVTDRDKGKWSLFSDGMRQIREYYLFMKDKLVENGKSINDFFEEDHIIPFICMKNLPAFKPKANAQRMTEMDKFRTATNLKIQYGISYDF